MGSMRSPVFGGARSVNGETPVQLPTERRLRMVFFDDVFDALGPQIHKSTPLLRHKNIKKMKTTWQFGPQEIVQMVERHLEDVPLRGLSHWGGTRALGLHGHGVATEAMS